MRETCTISNKSAGLVYYKIPEMNISRTFSPREKKTIKVTELEALASQPGGKRLIYDYLMVHEPDVLQYVINGEVSIEYWLTEEQLPTWINSCSLDEFKDALDFAPQGTKDLIKKLAVELPLNDFGKRQAIKDQLDFDVTKAIELMSEEPAKEEKKTVEIKPAGGRRSSNSSIVVPTTGDPAPKAAVVIPKTGE